MSGFKINFDPKKAMMEKLEDYDAHTLALALVYAKNIERYGIDVTQTWVTAIENDIALRNAFDAGYGAGYRSATGKAKSRSVYERKKIKPMHIESINYRFNVGDYVIFKNHGVNPITYVITDRCHINSEPYYKINTTGFGIPDLYEYCPESKLDLM